jgi:mannose-6-phosphate isomerase-like protein (cupin superfamily)
MNNKSDRIYYFLEGEGQFIFDGKTIQIEPDSVLFIPKNTPYKMLGKFKAVLAPGF